MTPCYNPITKEDCPNRHSGCAVGCSKWKEYTEQRDKAYIQRKRATDDYRGDGGRYLREKVSCRTGGHKR